MINCSTCNSFAASDKLSPNLKQQLCDLFSKVCIGYYKYPEDVAMAADELAASAWREVRESYPPSHLIEGEEKSNRLKMG